MVRPQEAETKTPLGVEGYLAASMCGNPSVQDLREEGACRPGIAAQYVFTRQLLLDYRRRTEVGHVASQQAAHEALPPAAIVARFLWGGAVARWPSTPFAKREGGLLLLHFQPRGPFSIVAAIPFTMTSP
jgi:hypothetical protein